MGKRTEKLMLSASDWRGNPNLSRCSHAAKGVYMDLLCLMWECDDRGVLATAGRAWSDEDILRAVGGDQVVVTTAISELTSAGILNRNTSGALYCKRTVRAEQVRQKRAGGGKLGGNPQLLVKTGPKVNLPVNHVVNLGDNLEVNLIAGDPSSSSSSPISPPCTPLSVPPPSPPPPTACACEPPAGFPRTAEEAFKATPLFIQEALGREDVEAIWYELESLGWVSRTGVPVRKWDAHVRVAYQGINRHQKNAGRPLSVAGRPIAKARPMTFEEQIAAQHEERKKKGTK